MKKENVIFCAKFVAFVFFCFFLFRMVVRLIDDVSSDWDSIFMAVSGSAFIVIDVLSERNKEDKNPLSIKKVTFVLEKVVDKRAGLKSEFVENFGIDMYNLFLERGYIHELFSTEGNNNEWQVTKLGLRRKVELCS